MIDYKVLHSFVKNGGYILSGKTLFFIFNERDYFMENNENNPSPTPIQEFAINDDYMDLLVTGNFCDWKILDMNSLHDLNYNGIWISRKFIMDSDIHLNDQFKFVVRYAGALRWINPRPFYDNIAESNGCLNLQIRG
ncbi:MAG: hypothetical protein JW969_02620 [Spirochaetales bacterium]|nr:hypothetical protein [Spirochaetales bacterium]